MLRMQLGDSMPVEDDPHGYVKLIDVMGHDEAVVDAARISYDRRGKMEDRGLIRYLLRHGHTSPFEMGVMKFELHMPIFVARQWVRHRTASLNEVSARYTQLPDDMFVPLEFAAQATNNKQGRAEPLSTEVQNIAYKLMQRSNDDSYVAYQTLLDMGVAREQAREVLNLNIYTKFIWKMDLHNLMHFLSLRLDPHAQKEIRVYAEVIETMMNLKFPICYEAFVDYKRDAYLCSRMEVELLQMAVGGSLHYMEAQLLEHAAKLGMSKREITAFKEKFHGE